MLGIGISFGVEFDNSSCTDRDPVSKQAKKAAEEAAAANADQPGLWEAIFGKRQTDQYVSLPKYMYSPETYAAWRKKNGILDEPKGG